MEADLASGEGGDRGAGLPCDDAFDFVAGLLDGVGPGEAGDGFAIGILDFDEYAAGGTGGEVQPEFATRETDGARGEGASAKRGVDRCKAVEAQGVSDQVGGRLGVVRLPLGRHFGGTGSEVLPDPSMEVLRSAIGPPIGPKTPNSVGLQLLMGVRLIKTLRAGPTARMIMG